MTELDELFERARGADIAEVAGVRLFRAGRRLRGECPLCGASKGKRASGAFSADPEKGVFKCFACEAGGDVIELERRLRGGSPREAAERLLGNVDFFSRPGGRENRHERAPRAPERSPYGVAPAVGLRPAGRSQAPAAVRQAWREAWPDAGEVRAYLAGRGITGRVAAEALRRLRFHPAMLWEWDDDPRLVVHAPAMLAEVRGPPTWSRGRSACSLPDAPGDPTGGFHATYLATSRDGRWRKASLDPAKRMWGPQRDLDGLPGAVWLTDPEGDGPLLVAEGIESGLSAAMLLDRPCRVVATLALGRLQGGWLTDRWGRIDPDCVSSDPERPPFTVPIEVFDDGRDDELVLAVDRDMKPIKVKARRAGGGSYEREISGEERARICASLAEQAWRRAGWTRVTTIAPAMGRDFNDELLARRAT